MDYAFSKGQSCVFIAYHKFVSMVTDYVRCFSRKVDEVVLEAIGSKIYPYSLSGHLASHSHVYERQRNVSASTLVEAVIPHFNLDGNTGKVFVNKEIMTIIVGELSDENQVISLIAVVGVELDYIYGYG